MEKGKCNRCGEGVLWLRSATTHTLLAIDPTPTEDGDVCVVDDLAHVCRGDLWEEVLPATPRYRQHAKTCANSGCRKEKGGKK